MMKKIFLYLLAAFPAIAFAQDPQVFTVKGKIGNLNAPQKAYLAYQLGANKMIDSAAISNGSFTFTGRLLNPTGATLFVDHRGTGISKVDSTSALLNFYLEKGKIDINGKDSARTAEVT